MEFDFYFFVFGKRRQLCDSDTFSEIFYVKFQCWFISSSSFSFLGSCAWTEMWREKINAKSNKIHLLCVVVSFVCVLLCARCVLCAVCVRVCLCVECVVSFWGRPLCLSRTTSSTHCYWDVELMCTQRCSTTRQYTLTHARSTHIVSAYLSTCVWLKSVINKCAVFHRCFRFFFINCTKISVSVGQ